MTKHFHDELQRMRTRVLDMGDLARRNLAEGVQSLLERDHVRASGVLRREATLNRLDVEIERDVLDLLALNQPMAQDLRVAGASLKIITYLDRIGRYGYDIAKIALGPHADLPGPAHPILRQMADSGLVMLDMALASYKGMDAAKARAVAARDDEVDRGYETIIEACVTHAERNPKDAAVAVRAVLVGRHLERAADNAQKIAEKTLYIVTGERRLAV